MLETLIALISVFVAFAFVLGFAIGRRQRTPAQACKDVSSVPRITITAKHASVSDQGRANHGDEGAIDIALARLREEALRLFSRRGRGRDDKYHFKLEIDRPRTYGRPA